MPNLGIPPTATLVYRNNYFFGELEMTTAPPLSKIMIALFFTMAVNSLSTTSSMACYMIIYYLHWCFCSCLIPESEFPFEIFCFVPVVSRYLASA